MSKIKLLFWGDYICNTGFATVSRNVLKHLHDTGDFDISVVGINYDGDPYDKDKWIGNIYPAMRGRMLGGAYMDVFGRQRLLDLISSNPPDVLFMLQDTFVVKDFIDQILQARDATGMKIVYYFPIDAEPHPTWITDVVSKVDYPITYTQYAKNECLKFDRHLKDKLEVIYHGTNTKEFYPIDKDMSEFRDKYFNGLANNKFLIMNLNRNQPRKDVLRSLLIQKELKDRGNNTLLYLHMNGQDVGGNINEWGDQLGLEFGKDYVYPENFGEGFSIPVINQLYNTADCVLTTTHGEGWGLSLTEAMSTKVPIVAPDNTSITEILADGRGYLVPSGLTNNDWYTQGQPDNNRIRPLMDVKDAADCIVDLIQGDKPDLDAAYNWAISQTWEVIAKQFERTIRKAASGRPKIAKTPDGQMVRVNREQRRKLKVK